VGWSGKGEGVIKGQRSMRRRSGKCLIQGRGTAIGDGRQEGARTHVGVRRRRVSKGKMEGNGKTARDGRSLYLDKAAGSPRYAALPDGAALNPISGRLSWKQERAAISPGAILLNKR